jgi:hypothetical protein
MKARSFDRYGDDIGRDDQPDDEFGFSTVRTTSSPHATPMIAKQANTASIKRMPTSYSAPYRPCTASSQPAM